MNPFPKITVCGVHELSECDLSAYSRIVSIWDPVPDGTARRAHPMRAALSGLPTVHFASFHDVPHGVADTTPATAQQIREILGFVRTAEAGSSLLIHCWAGVSRSTAIAYAILCDAAGPGLERECLAALLRLRPQALPNAHIVSLADRILDRRGAMSAACEDYLDRLSLS